MLTDDIQRRDALLRSLVREHGLSVPAADSVCDRVMLAANSFDRWWHLMDRLPGVHGERAKKAAELLCAAGYKLPPKEVLDFA
jgi:hypothetical protein